MKATCDLICDSLLWIMFMNFGTALIFLSFYRKLEPRSRSLLCWKASRVTRRKVICDRFVVIILLSLETPLLLICRNFRLILCFHVLITCRSSSKWFKIKNSNSPSNYFKNTCGKCHMYFMDTIGLIYVFSFFLLGCVCVKELH